MTPPGLACREGPRGPKLVRDVRGSPDESQRGVARSSTETGSSTGRGAGSSIATRGAAPGVHRPRPPGTLARSTRARRQRDLLDLNRSEDFGKLIVQVGDDQSKFEE